MLKSLLASIARKRPDAGPGDFGAAVAHFHAGRLGEANELAHRILQGDPDHAEAWNLLGAIALEQGDPSAAARNFEDAVALAPLDDRREPLQVAAEHRRLAQRIEVPARWKSLRHANTPDPERWLRIGYVSVDFCQHAASYFIEPFLSGHDGRAFDVICYAGVKRPDATTERLRRLAGTWRDVRGHAGGGGAAGFA